MSPGLLRRARAWYMGVGITTGRAFIWATFGPPLPEGYEKPRIRARVDTGVIKGMSALIPGPGGRP